MKRVGILISGGGSNMRALVRACETGVVAADIGIVLTDNPNAPGIEWARENRLAAHVVDRSRFASKHAFEDALSTALNNQKVELVCLAGFMRVLSRRFVDQWYGRLVNIHPSLLPSYRGLNTHARALADGVAIAGCTVHFVSPELDSGPIIGQAAVPVLPDDTPQTLAARVLAAEHRLFPNAVRLIVGDAIRLEDGEIIREHHVAPQADLFNPPLDC